MAFTQKEIQAYCQSKPDLRNIYALGYDFDTFENVIYLSLNTLEEHQKTLEEYAKLSYMQSMLDNDEGMREVKFSPGTWRHVAFAEFKSLQKLEDDAWKRLDTQNETSDSTKIWYENFHALVNAITETLLDYAQDLSLKQLPITEEPYLIAINHDESFLDAEKRMQRIATQYCMFEQIQPSPSTETKC